MQMLLSQRMICLSKVDCITNLTDNTVVASLPTILEKANDKKDPGVRK